MRNLLAPVLLLCAAPAPISDQQSISAVIPQGDISAAQWTAILKAARAGSTIDLGTRRVTFERFKGLANVTIKGGVFGAITLDQWRNVTFSGTRFEPFPGDDPRGPFIIAYDPDGLHFNHTKWSGTTTPDNQLAFSSLSIRGGNNVVVSHSSFRDMANFMAFLRTTNVQVTDNDFSNIREGVQLVGTSNALVARNSFGPYRPAPGDHADAIQLFTAGLKQPDDHGARDVVIENNLVDPGVGQRTQGIFIRDEANLHAAGRGYSNIMIRNNLLVGTGWHGISAVDPVERLTIENNRLFIRHGPDKVTDNWIMVEAGGGIVRNNTAGSFLLNKHVQAQSNKAGRRPAKPADIQQAEAVWHATVARPAN
ncbi:right-handed parallel beta-helix repeat-containing protein [uncultured Sphingomonas sp.]|uniref:right-handed parallel beta-helix repeat-containing protein n=1 Tax=uncultured Sphingomonas sp. TaxID=158754 RepID=UPI0026353108|nr:right-handed parallel beta-helix repeat-containing protein [uncultured Sphingomonas sp.]